MEIEWMDEKLNLLPQKAIWIQQRSMLVLADLHLGKINHFRMSGIPVPAKANDKNTETLIMLITKTKADRVVFLGDLFHSHYNEEWEVVGQVRKHFTSCSFELVVGNHDILSRLQYDRHRIFIHPEKLEEGRMILTHEPMETVPEGKGNLYGHIHPGVRLLGSGRQSLMLPCFSFGQPYAVLPAFGSFTGLAKINPKKEDRIFIIAENKVIAYPNA